VGQGPSPISFDCKPRATENASLAGRDVTARYFGSDLLGQEAMIKAETRKINKSKTPPSSRCPRIPNTCANIIMTFLATPLRRSPANIARYA
jgi:hypothetical protein